MGGEQPKVKVRSWEVCERSDNKTQAGASSLLTWYKGVMQVKCKDVVAQQGKRNSPQDDRVIIAFASNQHHGLCFLSPTGF